MKLDTRFLGGRLKARYLPVNQAYAVVDEIDASRPETWYVFRIFNSKTEAQACVSYCNSNACLPTEF